MEAEKAWQKNREINEPLQDIQKNITLKVVISGKCKAKEDAWRKRAAQEDVEIIPMEWLQPLDWKGMQTVTFPEPCRWHQEEHQGGVKSSSFEFLTQAAPLGSSLTINLTSNFVMKKNEGNMKVSPTFTFHILCFNFKENEDMFPTFPFIQPWKAGLIFTLTSTPYNSPFQLLCCFGYKGCACGDTQFSDFWWIKMPLESLWVQDCRAPLP